MKMKRRIILIVSLLVIVGIVLFVYHYGASDVMNKLRGRKTVNDRLTEYGTAARERLGADFTKTGIEYPPKRIVLVGLKDEKVLELYVGSDDNLSLIKTCPILAASGKSGPKLREGDMQVPEGIYRVVFLNPNSLYHLSMRLDYPNDFDREMAKKDGRRDLGGDIMIHGNNVSVGCLAVGDSAIEELFVLAADTGISNIEVILCPVDFRKRQFDARDKSLPAWTGQLYENISQELSKIPSGRNP